MKKVIFAFAALALAAASAAQSHTITLFQPTVINGTVLKPGEYKVAVKDNKAVITSGKTSVEADVKVEDSGAKFASSSVRYNNADGTNRVEEIRLGGTSTKLVFDASDSADRKK